MKKWFNIKSKTEDFHADADDDDVGQTNLKPKWKIQSRCCDCDDDHKKN